MLNTSVEIRALSTADLELGMYVSRLDRPWIETPFLFQGFHIEKSEVIEELRRYCKYVYVDTARADTSLRSKSRSTKAFPARKLRRSPAGATRAKSKVDRPSTGENSHVDTGILRAELAKAHDAHGAAEQVVRDLYKNIGAGRDVNLTSVQKSIDPMVDSIMRNDDALSWLVRMKRKDDYIYSHSIASAVWSMVFAKHLGLSAAEIQLLATGMVFLDVGKTRIPTDLLVKIEPLTPEESELMKTHVTHGVAIVSKIKGVERRVIEMVQSHHERYNGTGYPGGISGGDIPIFARIAGIIDTYDAMTTLRPYARLHSPYDATRQLSKLAGVEFPAEVVEQFIQAIGVFPVGTLVELNTGEVGMVVAQNRVRRLRPKVLLLLDRDKQPLAASTVIDLRNQLVDEANRQSLWIERGLAPGDYGLDPTEYYLQSH